MNLYDQPLTVTLTVRQWLETQCALAEAEDAYRANDFPYTAETTARTLAAMRAQTSEAITAAAAECSAYLDRLVAAA